MFNEDIDYEGLSICVVQMNTLENGGSIKLRRLRDIVDNQVVPCSIEKESIHRKPPFIYSNETNKILKEGFVGIWKWHAELNIKDSSKVFSKTKYDADTELTEIKKFYDVTSVEELKEELKALGSEERKCNCNLLCLYPKNEIFVGLFISKKQLIDGQYNLKENIFTLKKCTIEKEFISNSIIEGLNGTGMSFYKKTNLSFLKNVEMEPVKTENEIIKDELSNYYSNSIRSQIGLTRKELKKFKDIISDIPNKSLAESLKTKLQLEKSSIDLALEKFVKDSTEFISSEDIPSDVIYKIVNSRNDYHDKALDAYEKIWSTENQNKIDDLQEKLLLLQSEIKDKSTENSSVKDTLEFNKKALDAIRNKIQQNQMLGQEVEKKTKEKIEEAQKNVAEFIANVPFLNIATQKLPSNENKIDTEINKSRKAIEVQTSSSSVSNHDTQALHSYVERKEEKNYHQGQEYLNPETFESLQAALANLYKNLDSFDFSESSKLAIYLFSALKEQVPLLIAGPFGEQLIDILSVSLTGRHVSILDCTDDLNLSIIDQMNSGDEQIIAIKNIFNSKWINYLPELVTNTSKYVVVLHPFVEDLLIEPKGIYNYVQPLLTELFINENTGINTDFNAGIYNIHSLGLNNIQKGKVISFVRKFVKGSLVKSHLIQSLKTYHGLAEDEDDYYADLVYGCAPYALLHHKKEDFKDFYQNSDKAKGKIREILDEFLS